MVISRGEKNNMSKEIKDMDFDDLVKLGIQYELDNIVSGRPLKSRVWDLMNLAAQWSHEKQKK
jgi:hypothetical protein